MRILGVNGSLRVGSRTAGLVRLMLAATAVHGAEVEFLDLRVTALPLFADEVDYSGDAAAQEATRLVNWADGYVLGSPEYHGSMSGALKNFFDHYYHEFSGKAFALVAAAGGGSAISCLAHMRASVHYCHGWALPYQVGAGESEFDEAGLLTNARLKGRLEMLARDLTVYGPMLHAQFERDLDLGGPGSGFASFHRRARRGPLPGG